MKKFLIAASHMAVAGATGAAIGMAGNHWFPGGSVVLGVLYFVNHYFNVVPAVKHQCRNEIAKMVSDYHD